MQQLVDTQKEMRKAYLSQLISVTKDHNMLMENQIHQQQQLTEVN